jgi:hypothetical protein
MKKNISLGTTIKFKSELLNIGGLDVIRLNKETSLKLSTRGVAMIEGSINGNDFKTVLEPDGSGSHWFKLDGSLKETLKLNIGDIVYLEISQSENWIEPKPSNEWKSILSSEKLVNNTWKDISPLARWEFVRWMDSTNNPDTKKRRYEKAISLLSKGKRRPCCFNSNQCTVLEVSKSGVLLK